MSKIDFILQMSKMLQMSEIDFFRHWKALTKSPT